MADVHDSEEPSTGDGSEPFGSQWWEQHYQGQRAAAGVPSPHLVGELEGMPVGTALDAGCGTGADALWLASQGWDVTAVDISPTAVAAAEGFAADQTPEVAARVSWVVADLATWQPPSNYDLVVSQYVHPGIPFSDFVARLAGAVASGGTLFVAGHDHADDHSAAHAPVDPSVGLDAVVSVLGGDLWEIEVAEARTREVTHGSTAATMHDVVVKARRTTSG